MGVEEEHGVEVVDGGLDGVLVADDLDAEDHVVTWHEAPGCASLQLLTVPNRVAQLLVLDRLPDVVDAIAHWVR